MLSTQVYSTSLGAWIELLSDLHWKHNKDYKPRSSGKKCYSLRIFDCKCLEIVAIISDCNITQVDKAIKVVFCIFLEILVDVASSWGLVFRK